MKVTRLLLAALCAGTLLGGCKGKDGDPGPAGTAGATGPAGPAGPTGPIGPNLTGNIIGFVIPVDEFGREQAKTGVTVTLENTTPLQTATTDANGRYELTNVKSGTYNIAFSKPGFGTYKIQGYPHAGGDQPAFLYRRSISGISTTTVPNVNIGAIQTPGMSGASDYYRPLTATLANANVPNSNYTLRGLVFVGNNLNVTSTTGVVLGSVSYYAGQTNQYPFELRRAELNSLGFATGSTAYAIIYGSGVGYYGDYGYYDVITGKGIYTDLNPTPSRVVSFIVP